MNKYKDAEQLLLSTQSCGLVEKGNGPRSFQLARGLKLDQALQLVAALPDMSLDSVIPVLLQAAVFLREKKAGRAEELLGVFAEKFENKGTECAGDIDSADAVLDSAMQRWSDTMSEDSKLNVIMQGAASLSSSMGRRRRHLYENLVKSHGIDVDSLEKTSGAKHVESGPDVGISEPYEAKSKEKTEKKRKRKPRYPKRFDPANPGPPPDPERWLPKRERSSYSPREGKRERLRLEILRVQWLKRLPTL
ncbi:hypothetical protein F0562_033206 [Nyssa sinensis]|uniref:Signal recognition particle SRP72 subunit RNA-binding domain-containing protein n=1 Tax=Nyssa sinensis TaxID=561372 RepID=A0A5J5AW78_9ASTE|nr:hypothetical protein F0562_033206 [Nyssa sinensis]